MAKILTTDNLEGIVSAIYDKVDSKLSSIAEPIYVLKFMWVTQEESVSCMKLLESHNVSVTHKDSALSIQPKGQKHTLSLKVSASNPRQLVLSADPYGEENISVNIAVEYQVHAYAYNIDGYLSSVEDDYSSYYINLPCPFDVLGDEGDYVYMVISKK